MHSSRWAALAIAGVFALAIAVPARAQDVEVKPTAKVKRDKYLITAEELAEHSDLTNAYDAVKQLRPNFLKTTRSKGGYTMPNTLPSSSGSGGGGTNPDPYRPSGGMGSGGTVPGGGYVSAVLYVDERKQTAVEDLRNIRTVDVAEIRYLSGSEASNRYGSDHEGGAILLKTKRMGQQ